MFKRLRVLSALFVFFASLCEGEGPEDEIRRIVVVHFDTTRVDDWGCYGSHVKTPHVDALAAKGMRYTNAVTCAPFTSPSVASFLTGVYPLRHGVRRTGHRLNDGVPTLPEVLGAKGFVTAGFVSNPFIGRIRPSNKSKGEQKDYTLGYERGFDVWRSRNDRRRQGQPAGGTPKANCEWFTSQAIDFVRTHRDDRFFLWMLHFDPHTPYDPPPPYDTMYLNEPALLAKSVTFSDKQKHDGPYKASHQYVARHQGEVTHVDASLGKLMAELEGLDGKTLYVILADHGESLGDAGLWFMHGQNLRYPCINVPMVLSCEGVIPKGVSHALVDNTDLCPTILDLAHISRADLNLEGRSLKPTFSNEDPWPSRMTPMATPWGTDKYSKKRVGVRSKFFSLQCRYKKGGQDPSRILFYDHREDRKESTNIAEDRPEDVQAHLDYLTAKYVEMSAETAPVGKVDDEEMQERLKAMGYLE